MSQTYSPSDLAKSLLSKATAPITSEQLQNYQSPYQKQVIDATMAQLEQLYGKQQSALTGNAISQGALGGDRAKVAQAALMGEQGRNTASTLAGLEQQGYTQAMANAQQDLNRQIQAAGLSGGTTTGGSQMTGATTGQEAGTTAGSAASAQQGTSHTTGYSTSDTVSDPTIFGGNLGFHADGGGIRHRDMGGGVPSWAMPPPMQPVPLIQPPQSKAGKTMSTSDMLKLGKSARTELDKMFNSSQTGSANMGEGSGFGSDLAATDVGAANAASASGEAASAAGDAAAAGAGDAAAGAGETAGALGKGAAGAAGAGAGEAAGGAGKGAMSAIAALLADGGAVRHRSGGGGMDMPGMSMEEGIGQEWFKVPTINPTAGIKGSANGGEIRHRDAGGVVSLGRATAPMPSLPSQTLQSPSMSTPSVQMPTFDTPSTQTSNGKGSSPQTLESVYDALGKGQEYDKISSMGKGSSSAPPQNSATQPQDLSSFSSNGKGSLSMMADGGAARRRADGGADDFYDPYDPSSAGNVGTGSSGTLGALSSLTAEGEPDRPLDKPLTRAELEARREAEPGISDRLQSLWGRLSSSEEPAKEPTQLSSFVEPKTEERRPSLADLAPKPTAQTEAQAAGIAEPTPVKTFRIDPSTGNEVGAPAAAPAEAGPGPEPGASDIAPDKPQNHAQTVADGLRAAGMSENGIRGTLVNVQDESGFESGLRHPDQPHFTGEAHYAHGLFQIGGEEWNKFDRWMKENHPDADWRDPGLQTQFMAQNLKENYPQVWKAMNEGTAEEAAKAYVSGYLKPAKQHEAARLEKYGRGVPELGELTSAPSTSSNGVETPSSADRPKSLAGLAPSAERSQTAAPAAVAPAGKQEGNFLSRIVDAGFNPLKMSDRDLSFIAQTALGGLGGINKAADTAQAGRAQDIQAQQHALQMAMEAQKLQHSLAQPSVMGETYDQSTGVWHKQYGFFDPKTNRYIPSIPQGAAAPSGGPADIDAIPQDVTGKDFVDQAKRLGYSGNVLTTAQSVADYKADPSKLSGMKGEQRAIVNRLAQRINPDYDMAKYPAVADSEKKLATGDVAKSLRSVGRLFDEVDQAHSLADATGNTKYEYANRAAGEVYPSGSQYGVSRAKLGLSLNNVSNSASSVAKGGGSGAEGDAKRRLESMNVNQAPEALKGALKVEAETGLKIGQTNLESYNSAHGYTPDNPKYKTIMDYLTPSQQQKAVKLLGPDKIEEITGKPIKGVSNERPVGVSRVQQMTQAEPKPEAVQFLIKNPSTSSYFDAKYGPGAAKKVMSTQGAS
jgi:hypothetical protein